MSPKKISNIFTFFLRPVGRQWLTRTLTVWSWYKKTCRWMMTRWADHKYRQTSKKINRRVVNIPVTSFQHSLLTLASYSTTSHHTIQKLSFEYYFLKRFVFKCPRCCMLYKNRCFFRTPPTIPRRRSSWRRPWPPTSRTTSRLWTLGTSARWWQCIERRGRTCGPWGGRRKVGWRSRYGRGCKNRGGTGRGGRQRWIQCGDVKTQSVFFHILTTDTP